MPWLITSSGLVASRILTLTVFVLRHQQIWAVVVVGLVTAIAGGLAMTSASRRSTSRKQSPS